MAKNSGVQTHNAIVLQLIRNNGRGTADQLRYNYVQIEPLIRKKYVTVQNDNGTPVYVLTPDGQAYAEEHRLNLQA